MHRAVVCLCLTAFFAACAARADTPAACDAPDFRRLDFRIGTFDVAAAEGMKAGRSRVEAIVRACALVEHWQGAVSGEGRAWYVYDAARRRWHMTFINSDGDLLRMSGAFDGDSLVLEGDDSTFVGRPVRQRMSWSPLPNGGVLQRWQISEDAGRTWRHFFEGHYTRRADGERSGADAAAASEAAR